MSISGPGAFGVGGAGPLEGFDGEALAPELEGEEALDSRLPTSTRPLSTDLGGQILLADLEARLAAREAPPASPSGGIRDAELKPDMQAVGAAITESVGGLAPAKFESGDPIQLAKGVKDGKVAIEIPLAPGKHKIRGFPVTVKQNTVMKVYVDVKDGKLVPARDARGAETGGGTKVDFVPPLDLPIVSGRGIYLREGRGDAPAKLKADIGGFFDIKIKEAGTLELADLLDAVGGNKLGVAGEGRKAGDANGPLPKELLQLDKMKFEVTDVQLHDGVLDTGTVRVDLAPGSNLTLSGTLEDATLKGRINIDSARMDQGGMTLEAGAGTASFEARYVKNPDGSMAANTRITNLEATIDRLETQNASGDRVKLGKTSITNGTIEANMQLAPRPGTSIPQVVGVATAATFDAKGRIEDARITVKDARDDATISIGGADFAGRVSVGNGRTAIDGALTNANLGVRDLQSADGEGGRADLDIHHANLQGNATIQIDSEQKVLDIDVDAKSLDIRVDDYQATKGAMNVDLSTTEITGAGRVRLGRRKGIEIEGALKVKGGFDDFKIAPAQGKAAIDVASGTTLDADVTRFVARPREGVEIDAKGKVDVGLESYSVNLPGVSATGTARVRAGADVRIRADEFLVANLDGTISVAVDDAKVAPGGKGFNLDAGKGSRLDLNVKGSTISSDSSKTEVKLGPGSKLEAVLDGGEITVEGKTVKLERGSKARFDIASLSARPGGAPALKGSLTVDANVRGADFDLQGLPKNARVSVSVGEGGSASAKVKIDDVTLRGDGSFSLDGVNVGVHAKAQTITGAQGANGVAVGTLSPEKVKASTAAEIAGAKGPAATAPLSPIEIAKKIDDGVFEVEIPVEGTIGEGYLKSATFAPGTTIKVAVTVKDGEIDTKATKVTLSQPGDAALWVTVHSVYFDESNTLRLGLGGMVDIAVPKMRNMPTDIDAFIDRLTGAKPAGGSGDAAGAGGADAADKLSAVKLDRMKISVKDATIEGGKIPVPGGFVDISPNTKISVSGTPQAAVVTGHVALDGVDIAQDGIALKTGKGTADLRIEYRSAGGEATVLSTLSNMNLDVQYAVQKRTNGDYIHLANGKVQGASLSMTASAPVSGFKPTGKPVLGAANFDLPRFQGTIEGGRITIKDRDGTAQVDIGRTLVNGAVRVDHDKIEVQGQVTQLDVGIRDFAGGGAAGTAGAGYARVRGSGTVDFSTAGGLSVDANVRDLDVRGGEVDGRFNR